MNLSCRFFLPSPSHHLIRWLCVHRLPALALERSTRGRELCQLHPQSPERARHVGDTQRSLSHERAGSGRLALRERHLLHTLAE